MSRLHRNGTSSGVITPDASARSGLVGRAEAVSHLLIHTRFSLLYVSHLSYAMFTVS